MRQPLWLMLIVLSLLSARANAGAPAAPVCAGRCGDLAKGRFLVASRRIADPRFSESVILLVDHDDKGTLGLIINRGSEIRLSEALPQVDSLRQRDDKLFFGGPVSRRQVLLLMRTSHPPPGAILVFGSIYFSLGSSLLDDTLGKDIGSFRAYAGYAGWGAGQLASELARGDWFVAEADVNTIFSAMPASIWPALIMRFEGQWAMQAALQPGC
jgi:putative transcriptional regulator